MGKIEDAGENERPLIDQPTGAYVIMVDLVAQYKFEKIF
jgi:hypothetical protein